MGEVDPEPFNDCLRRLAAWEPHIEAWSQVDTGVDFAALQDGPLEGACFAVKDVIDVAGLPTRFGSRLFSDTAPAANDAPVVAALRAAGAMPVGKTRTTEFAFIDPTITRNPYDKRRSPGGSSSGSGAAVGARVVPFALGTQTAGSLCRPAAYCGGVSYKPGLGRLPTAGMAALSPSFDAIGVIAQSVTWLRRVFDVLDKSFPQPTEPVSSDRTRHPLKIGLVSSVDQTPLPEVRHAMGHAVDRFRSAGHAVTSIPAPVSFADLIGWHRTIMLYEAAAAILPLVGPQRHLLGPKLAAGLLEGEGIGSGLYRQAVDCLAAVAQGFWRDMTEFDLLLAYAVPGPAPAGLATTGDQSYLTPWTALSGPLVSLVGGQDVHGMPLGILLAAPPGKDQFLMAAAEALDSLLPDIPPPALPVSSGASTAD